MINQLISIFVGLLIVIGCCTLTPRVWCAVVPPRPLELERLLWAVRQIENWDGHSVSASGARGPYQIKEDTWYMHSCMSFVGRCTEGSDECEQVARTHAVWILATLHSFGLESTPFNFGMAWKAGLHGLRRREWKDADVDYATRFSNIYLAGP